MKRLDRGQPVACSLNDQEFRDRRDYIRRRLAPNLDRAERVESGLILHFKGDEALRNDLEEFVTLEQQCCGFLTFDISPERGTTESRLQLRIDGPPEARATLEMLARGAGCA